MSTELVYLMRTCAAALLDGREVPKYEIADIMIEASNAIDAADVSLVGNDVDLGSPMELLRKRSVAETNVAQREALEEALEAADKKAYSGGAVWGGDLPAATPQPCPSCGAVSARTVKREGRSLMLTCPQCGSTWEYGK